MASILVLDGNQRSALAVVRSLGHQGHMIYVADCTDNSLAATSQYCLRHLISPSPTEETSEFLDWISGIVRNENIGLILPVTEITSQLLLQTKYLLPSACVLPFADYEKLILLADKIHLIKLASSIGVPYPESQIYAEGSSYDSASVQTFPVVLKPARSVFFQNNQCIQTSVRIAHSQEQLKTILNEDNTFGTYPFMVQEYIPGHGAGVFALYDHGQPVAFFAHQRLREKPPAGGVSVLSKSVEIDPELLSMTKKLLDAVQWHGVAMVEFRIDLEGLPWLMEVNTRFWGSLQLAVDSGVDFPHLLCQTALGETAEKVKSYRTGQRLRWLLGDLDSLYLYLRDDRYKLVQKCSRILEFLTPRPWCTRHEINRWGDMGPAWFELKQYCRHLFRR